jgi:hypothetical protein
MLNDTSVFPAALSENAVTRPIAYHGKEASGWMVLHRPTEPAGQIGTCRTDEQSQKRFRHTLIKQ